MKGVDWQRFVFDPTTRWVERLLRLAERRFPDVAVAGAAFNSAFQKISDGDWQVLQNYAGRAQPGTYLTAVFCRFLEDYSRARFGRPRPPAWLKRLGELWARVYQMLCLERMEVGSIVDRLAAQNVRLGAEVSQMVAVIKARIPDCGASRGEIAMADPSEARDAEQQDSRDPESELSQQELAQLLAALGGFFYPVPGTSAMGFAAGAVCSALAQRLEKVRRSLELNDEERLILKLLYQDGCTVAVAACALRLPEHQVRRRCDRAVSRLRATLRQAGIGPELLRGD